MLPQISWLNFSDMIFYFSASICSNPFDQFFSAMFSYNKTRYFTALNDAYNLSFLLTSFSLSIHTLLRLSFILRSSDVATCSCLFGSYLENRLIFAIDLFLLPDIFESIIPILLLLVSIVETLSFTVDDSFALGLIYSEDTDLNSIIPFFSQFSKSIYISSSQFFCEKQFSNLLTVTLGNLGSDLMSFIDNFIGSVQLYIIVMKNSVKTNFKRSNRRQYTDQHQQDKKDSVYKLLSDKIIRQYEEQFNNISGNAMSGNTMPGNIMPGNIMPGNIMPGNIMPGNIMPGNIKKKLFNQQSNHKDAASQLSLSQLTIQFKQSSLIYFCDKFEQELYRKFDIILSAFLELEYKIASCQKKFNAIQIELTRKAKQVKGLIEQNRYLSAANMEIEEKLERLKEDYERCRQNDKKQGIEAGLESITEKLNQIYEKQSQINMYRLNVYDEAMATLDQITISNHPNPQQLSQHMKKLIDGIYKLSDLPQSSQQVYSYIQEKILENIELKFKLIDLELKVK